jgi:ATP-dependent DNA helicase RecQ
VCRRRQLLNYFGEEYPDENCSACDVCANIADKMDITVDAQVVMSAMARTGQRFGIRYIIDVICGADTKRIRDFHHDMIKTYGAGRDRDKYFWHFVVDELLAQGLIYRDGDKYPVLKLTERGSAVLKGEDRIFALKREDRKKRIMAAVQDGATRRDERLFERLRTVRKQLAKEHNVPPFIIFSDRSLNEMCRHFPVTLPDMRNINGVGDTKLKQYGRQFIEVIKAYLEENPVE